MKGLAPAQISVLNQLYAQAGSQTIPSDWLIDNSIPPEKLDLSLMYNVFATSIQGAKADSALQPGQAATPDQGALADSALQPGQAATPAQGAKADSALQPGQAATPAQGALADSAVQPTRTISTGTGLTGGGDLSADRTISLNAASIASLSSADSALQPGGNLTGSVNSVAVGTLTSQASNGQTAYGWGDHALAGYLTSAPVMKVYQTTATGASPETFTLPNTPATGSEVIVFVEQTPHHLTASDPPSAGDFYRSGTTIKVDTTAGDRISIYYTA